MSIHACRPLPALTHIVPWGGLQLQEADEWVFDPMGTYRTTHDVVPGEALRQDDPDSPYHNGAERDMARIAKTMARVMAEHGLVAEGGFTTTKPMHNERFHIPIDDQEGGPSMDVNVVNVVFTSYCAMEKVTPESTARYALKKARKKNTSNLVMSSVWMWRRLLHLGPQINNIHTSLKICYASPHKASHLIRETMGILETGADNLNVASIMLEEGTLKYFHAAGAKRLRVHYRASHNVVATSQMPHHLGLELNLLKWRLETATGGTKYVKVPAEFPGIIITHPNQWAYKKVKFLAFPNGAVVIVGPATIAVMGEAIREFVPILWNNVATPEAIQLAQRLLARGTIHPLEKADKPSAKSRKRKRET
jgi:hypothetical protein